MLIMCRLIPKKVVTKDRATGPVSMLGRMWSLIREPHVQDWSKDHAEAWGAAVAGNSRLRGAYLRAIDEELARTMGMNYGPALTDVQEFYDSIPWHLLASAALRLSFPPVIL
eukprot:7161077-Pyramimonas_sp.AAC.1